MIPGPLGLIVSIFTNNAKKWRDMAKQLELHAALFFWWLAVEISFLPTMVNHHVNGDTAPRYWEDVVNKIIISIFVWVIVNLIEKVIIQFIAISFHMRTYADRIEISKFQIGSLTKLYSFSRAKITAEDSEFEENQPSSGAGTRTPMAYAKQAHKQAVGALNKVGDVAGAVAADFTGRKASKSSDPHQVILALLRSQEGSQILARRLYRTFVRDGFDTVFAGDLKEAFDNNEEAEAAFAMFDKDLNGDISMEELEAVCVEIGRERKAVTASLKDLDSVVSRLDNVFSFLVFIIALMVFLSLISASTAAVLTSAGSTILALSWLFSGTAQEFLASVIFVFIKHPYDVGDRVTVYANTGDAGMGDDYFVKSISLLYTEFKKMQGHIVQAPNSYLNSIFILNQRRSGPLAEAVPVTFRYGTTIEQMEALRQRLLEFVRVEKREFQTNILTELREVSDNFALTMNVVFFYKSNWQNELLRLIRRNKFICMLMIAMQEVGIEGTRFNLAGYKAELPSQLRSIPEPPPKPSLHSNDHDDDGGPAPIGSDMKDAPEDTGTSSARRHPSILRRGADKAAATARGDGSSRKHVDFSLGMREVSTIDMGDDVFEDRASGGASSIVRAANREASERRMQEIREEAEEARSQRSSRSHRRSQSNISLRQQEGEPGRPSHESHHSVRSFSSIHRNRLFHRDQGSDQGDLEAQDTHEKTR